MLLLFIAFITLAGLASIEIHRLTGAGPSQTDVTGINSRLNAEDAHSTAGTTNTVEIPQIGTNYSYWGSFQLNAISSPANTIDNIRCFSDGSNTLGTGLTAKMGVASSYHQATGTLAISGNQLTGSQCDVTSPADVFGYTSASPLSVPGTLNNPSTGLFGDILMLQGEVGTTASPPSSTQEAITFYYDES